jgi:hypothetical protein
VHVFDTQRRALAAGHAEHVPQPGRGEGPGVVKGLSNSPSAVSSSLNSVPVGQARAARMAAGKTTWPVLERLRVFIAQK